MNKTHANPDFRDAGKILLWTVGTILLMLILQVVLMKVAGAQPDAPWFLTFTLLSSPWVIALPSLVYVIRRGWQPAHLNLRKFRFSALILGFIALQCISPLASFLNMLTMKLGAKNLVSASLSSMDSIPTGVLLVGIAILPGILEEFQFRGLYYTLFRRAGFFPAAVMSALFFALVHMNFNQFAYAFALGLFFAYLAEASGSVYVTMILHALFNASSVLLVRGAQTIMEQAAVSGDPTMQDAAKALKDSLAASETVTVTWGAVFSMGFMAAIGLLISVLLLRKIAKMNGRQDMLQGWFRRYVPVRSLFHVFTVIACVLLVGIMILTAVGARM